MYSGFTHCIIHHMSTSDPVPPTDDPKSVQIINDPPRSGSSEDLPSTLGGLSGATATENDGFVTPTNSDHRIPEIRPCPPPPRKSTAAAHRIGRIMPPLKRKRSADDVCQTPPLLLDLSSEIESMFPPILHPNLTCKIKKARSV